MIIQPYHGERLSVASGPGDRRVPDVSAYIARGRQLHAMAVTNAIAGAVKRLRRWLAWSAHAARTPRAAGRGR